VSSYYAIATVYYFNAGSTHLNNYRLLYDLLLLIVFTSIHPTAWWLQYSVNELL